MFNMSVLEQKYTWDNFASTEDLAELFKVTKRRIQQVINKWFDEGRIEMVVAVYEAETPRPFAKPLYRRLF